MKNAFTYLLILGAIASTIAHADAQTSRVGPQPVPMPQTINGIIVQAIQPFAVTSQANPISSLLWIYDTNTKQLKLCRSHIDGNFDCTKTVTLSW